MCLCKGGGLSRLFVCVIECNDRLHAQEYVVVPHLVKKKKSHGVSHFTLYVLLLFPSVTCCLLE